MSGVGLWKIKSAAPQRLQASDVGLEADLEGWIERDPNLLEHGLIIVARQLRTEAGPLDLLGIDIHGRWVLIEIKRERLHREVIAQAIDYASCLSRYEADRLREQCDKYLQQHGSETLDGVLRDRGRSLDDEAEVELLIYLIGTAIDASLERMVGYLSDTVNLSIRIVTFAVFEDDSGDKLLAREIHEPMASESPSRASTGARKPVPSEEELLARADQNGVGHIVRPILDAAVELGLHPRRYAKSFMIAPSQNKTRCLIYLPVDRSDRMREDKLGVMIVPEAFEQFFGVEQARAVESLCEAFDADPAQVDGGVLTYLDGDTATRFASQLRELLA